ncbi:unnamed protein product [Calypogeia fissa]
MGVTGNHMHVDGHAFFKFMEAWCDFSRENGTAITVDHDRAKVEVPALQMLMATAAAAAAQGDPTEHLRYTKKMPEWAAKTFQVSALTIKALKKEVKQTNTHSRGGYVSTVDCIQAQFLKSFKGPSKELSSLLDDKEVVVTRVVEGRVRFFHPPLTDVCGNATILALSPEIPTSEVLEMPLATIACKYCEQLEDTKREEWLGLEGMGRMLQPTC